MGRDITQIFFTTSVSKELFMKPHIQEELIFFPSNWIGRKLLDETVGRKSIKTIGWSIMKYLFTVIIIILLPLSVYGVEWTVEYEMIHPDGKVKFVTVSVPTILKDHYWTLLEHVGRILKELGIILGVPFEFFGDIYHL